MVSCVTIVQLCEQSIHRIEVSFYLFFFTTFRMHECYLGNNLFLSPFFRSSRCSSSFSNLFCPGSPIHRGVLLDTRHLWQNPLSWCLFVCLPARRLPTGLLLEPYTVTLTLMMLSHTVSFSIYFSRTLSPARPPARPRSFQAKVYAKCR